MNRKKVKPEVETLLDFLEPELKEFIKDVTILTQRRWLKNYDREILENTIADCYEWCHGNDITKNIGSRVSTFLKDKPKRNDDLVLSLKLLREGAENDSET